MNKKKTAEKVLFKFSPTSFRDLCDKINEDIDEFDDCEISFLSTGKIRISGEFTEYESININIKDFS